MKAYMAMAVITLLVIGTLGGVTIGVAETQHSAVHGWNISDCDGDDPPPDPNAIPGGDPEHPQ